MEPTAIPAGPSAPADPRLERLLSVVRAVEAGDFRKRVVPGGDDVVAEICAAVNGVATRNQAFKTDLERVCAAVSQEGRLGARLTAAEGEGDWASQVAVANAMLDGLTRSLEEIARVLGAIAGGDLSQQVAADGHGDIAALAGSVNALTVTLRTFASEVTRVALEFGSEGRLGGRAEVPGVAGTWKDLTDSVNLMTGNLTAQVRDIAQVATAVAGGDLSRKITADVRGELLELKTTLNTMVDQLSAFAAEVTRVAREVGTEGTLGGQARVPGVAGTWKDLTDSVNFMAANLTGQVRNIAQVATAVARGDLSQKIDVDVRGEILELKVTLNTMVDQLSAFAAEVTRVAREVGTEGMLGGQAEVPGVAGTWRDLTDSVNWMANNLTDQVRNIAQVTTAVAQGDLTKKIDVDARGEILRLKTTINTMVDQLSAFASEVTRVAREVGTEGNLGGQATVRGVSGTWKDLTDNVNVMANNLTGQVRSIARAATAVAQGDLTKKITVEAKGEVAALADTFNDMVDTLSAFADEVTRVAREVGTEGILGGQARVPGVAGTWKELTDRVNVMADNLTSQVRNIAQVTTAVAEGDLTKKIDVDARGEILELKVTLNTMVDQLSAFASEVTRVAREVGTDGILGGQAEVEDVSGTWKKLTDSVNQLAANLTEQVRAIAVVATAVTEGDLTRRIDVDARGEVAELKDNINQMIVNLGETTRTNQEQDWLKTNLARIGGLLQGHRDLTAMAGQVMDELAPLVGAHSAAFFLAETGDGPIVAGEEPADVRLNLVAGFAHADRPDAPPTFALGQGLIGQVALQKRAVTVTGAPAEHVRISSGLGWSQPHTLAVLPILYEGQVFGVVELATVNEFTQVHRDFLEQVTWTIGAAMNTIAANVRTDALLRESQRLTGELQSRQQQLQESNEELEDKATQLARQNRDIELKNAEIEQARRTLEERAGELAEASKVKSEFMANMSHELRTPLNSLLILARLLSKNPENTLTSKEIGFAQTIFSAGSDLLQLIDDLLDLAKIEAGRMEMAQERWRVADLVQGLAATFGPLASDKGLELELEVAADVPESVVGDSQRVQQVLRNFLSNAVKFTDAGKVTLRVEPAVGAGDVPLVSFAVQDTGIGIPEDKLDLIFEAFQQADGTTSRRYGGTGLGLSISRQLTRLLGGELRVDSLPDEGSTFTLTLPVSPQGRPSDPDRDDDTVLRPEPETLTPAGGTPAASRRVYRPDTAGLSVLIVAEPEGVSALAETVARAVSGLGPLNNVEILASRDDGEVAKAAVRERLRCVVLDAALPAAEQEALRQAVRLHASNVPVLLYHPEADASRHPKVDSRLGPEIVSSLPQVAERLTHHLPAFFRHGQAGPQEATAFPNRHRFDGEKILVVDDDTRNLFALSSALELSGLSVVCADNGREGVELLARHQDVALVLVDVMMPGMDGYATTRRIRDLPRCRELPIIAVTAKAMKGDREKSLAAGMDEYISKPVDIDKLLRLIHDLVPPRGGPWPDETGPVSGLCGQRPLKGRGLPTRGSLIESATGHPAPRSRRRLRSAPRGCAR